MRWKLDESSKYYKKGFKDGYLRGDMSTQPNWKSDDYWHYKAGYERGIREHLEEIENERTKV